MLFRSNQIVLAYNSAGRVKQSWQSHDGVAVTSGGSESPKIKYQTEGFNTSDPDDVLDDGTRLVGVQYPDGGLLRFERGHDSASYNSNTLADRLGQITGLEFNPAEIGRAHV